MTKLLKQLAVVVALWLALEAALPEIASVWLAKNLGQQFGSTSTVVKIDSRPAISMLAGQIDTVNFRFSPFKVDRLNATELQGELKGVQLDWAALSQAGQASVKEIDQAVLNLTVGQDELTRYLNESVKGVKNGKVTIQPDRVTVDTQFALANIASLAVTLEGRIIVDGTKLKFVTDRFYLNGRPVGALGGSMLTEIALLDASKLPFGVTLRQVEMQSGQLVIHADRGL